MHGSKNGYIVEELESRRGLRSYKGIQRLFFSATLLASVRLLETLLREPVTEYVLARVKQTEKALEFLQLSLCDKDSFPRLTHLNPTIHFHTRLMSASKTLEAYKEYKPKLEKELAWVEAEYELLARGFDSKTRKAVYLLSLDVTSLCLSQHENAELAQRFMKREATSRELYSAFEGSDAARGPQHFRTFMTYFINIFSDYSVGAVEPGVFRRTEYDRLFERLASIELAIENKRKVDVYA